MYSVYLEKMLLPVTPSKITIKTKGQNKTIDLIDSSQINILKKPGLSEISFDILLPQEEYHFSNYWVDNSKEKDNEAPKFKKAKHYLDKIEKLKDSRKPFTFVVWRERPGVAHGVDKKTKHMKLQKTHLYDTCMVVSLESYEIKEDVENGFDVIVSINLKQFNAYGTKLVTIKKPKKDGDKPKATTTKKRDTSSKEKPKTHKVVNGDCLWNIAKKYYEDADRWKSIYNSNKEIIEKAAKVHGRSSSSNGHWIYPGIVLKLP